MPVFLNASAPEFEAAFTALLSAKREEAVDVDDTVAAIIADVRARGDAAVIELTAKFDKLELTPDRLAFSPAEIAAEVAKVPADERAALELAAARIRAYHERQRPADARWTDDTGAELGWRWGPVAAAGLYVPGGLASYPSSVLMNAIPAQVAGVERLVICAPTPGGVVNPLVLLAAQIAGGGHCLPHWRGAGRGGHGLWHRHHRASGQDHRAGQCLCCRRQAPGVRARGHRHDRGPVRDFGNCRQRQRPRLDRAGPAQPSRA